MTSGHSIKDAIGHRGELTSVTITSTTLSVTPPPNDSAEGANDFQYIKDLRRVQARYISMIKTAVPSPMVLLWDFLLAFGRSHFMNQGNVFVDVSRGVLIGGGRDNHVLNNIFVQAGQGLEYINRVFILNHKFRFRGVLSGCEGSTLFRKQCNALPTAACGAVHNPAMVDRVSFPRHHPPEQS